MKREAGFSLIEILITLAILSVVLAAVTETFVNLMRGFKQQGKIAETNIEGIIGLEILRRDIESAGYGLPWVIPSGVTFTEKADYGDATVNPPRAILSGNEAGWNDTDYLVIKAVNVARNSVCSKWTNLFISSGTPTTTVWDPASENLESTDRVIVISPGTTEALARSLIASGGSYTTTFSLVTDLATTNETRIVYGMNDPDDSTNVKRPFHRADYYVAVPASSDMPSRCASGTGILYKNVLNQGNDILGIAQPLIDCVADMQVITRHDTNNDGTIDTDANGMEGTLATNAQTIRNQLKEVRMFILAHEGQKDSSFIYPLKPGTCDDGKILVGDSVAMGRCFDLAANITDWRNYRWKVYTLVVKPNNLR